MIPVKLEDIIAERCRRSFKRFMVEAWPYADPAPFLHGWHMDAIADHLQAVGEGKIQLLAINIPPGHAKSMEVSVMWPAWMWTWRPTWQGVFSSYVQQLAERDSTRCRDLMLTPWYQRNFVRGLWTFRPDHNTKHDYFNTMKGRRLATSVTGSNTGHRGDCVTTDDPQDVAGAASEADRLTTNNWWGKTMSSRLNNPATGARVLVQQRLDERDLTSQVLEAGYTHLCLPSEYNPRRKCVTFTKDKCKFWEDPRTEDGELLFPELYTRAVIEQAKRDMGSQAFSAQHNQNPTPLEGGMFKRKHWRFWKPAGLAPTGNCPRPEGTWEGPARALPDNLIEVISVDAAFKDGRKNDWVVMTVIGYGFGADRYVLDRVRGHFDFQRTCDQLRALCNRHPMAYSKLVEDAANGTAVVNFLASEIPGLIPVKPEGGKESRAAICQPSVEAGQVFLPEGAGWLDEWVDEFAAFPKGRHDDQVDAFSQAMNYLSNTPDMARAIAMVSM